MRADLEDQVAVAGFRLQHVVGERPHRCQVGGLLVGQPESVVEEGRPTPTVMLRSSGSMSVPSSPESRAGVTTPSGSILPPACSRRRRSVSVLKSSRNSAWRSEEQRLNSSHVAISYAVF